MPVALVILVVAAGGACATESERPDIAGSATTASGSGSGPASLGPVVGDDHWHAAVGMYACDEFLPDLGEFESDTGIHTHGDGVIHIHPFTEAGAGTNATLGLFLDEAVVALGDGELTVYGVTYDECDGEPAELQIAQWDDVAAGGDPDTVVDDPSLLPFVASGEGYTVALVPDGTEIPPPPSSDDLEELGASDGPSTDASAGTDAPAGTGAPPPVGEGPASDPATHVADGFLPVLEAIPASDGVACAPGRLGGEADGLCYLLGDDDIVALDGAVESATVEIELGQPRIGLVLTEPGIDAFNDLAALCYGTSEACPTGQVAVVVGDRVVSAPAIMEPEFEADQIQVSGGFTTDEADAIAAAMTG